MTDTDVGTAVAALEGAGLPIASSEPPATMAAAIQRIRTWHELLRNLSDLASAQVMESLHVVRGLAESEARFREIVGTQLAGIVEPDRAVLMARTWEIARERRELREVARSRPSQALEFVDEFVRAGRIEDLEGDGADDAVRLLTLPPRQRVKAARTLIAERNERAPDDDADPFAETPDSRRERIVQERIDAALQKLGEGEMALDKASWLFADAAEGTGVRLPAAVVKRLLALTDLVIGHAERIATLASDD